jgi:hypothetical protein
VFHALGALALAFVLSCPRNPQTMGNLGEGNCKGGTAKAFYPQITQITQILGLQVKRQIRRPHP